MNPLRSNPTCKNRIADGYAADVIAVEGDPLENIRVMEDVRFVMRDGRVVKAP